MKLYINGNAISVDAKKSLGKGMEADVYRFENLAVKVFKNPNHPDLLTDADRLAARRKIEEHQEKLRSFPQNLPNHVVVPIDLVQDGSGKIVGYTMRLVDNPKQARVFSQVTDRLAGLDPNQIVRFFSDLHPTVNSLHNANVVIGDFNDLNILVSGDEAHIIDADSFQFGKFACHMFTEEFVDPRLCNKQANTPVLGINHDDNSDWYAYTVMLFKILLCVSPFGGIYRPAKQKDNILQTQRSLKGISVFNPNVVYPKKGIHYKVLPDAVLDYFQKTFESSKRGVFPKPLLDSIRWVKCDSCGLLHARVNCPDCKVAPPIAAVREKIEVQGQIKSTMVFRTSGRILYSTVQEGQLRWVYNENSKFYREDRNAVFNGTPEPSMKYRIFGTSTVVGKGSNVFVLPKDGTPVPLTVDMFQDRFCVFDASESGVFWSQGGSLVKNNKMGFDFMPEKIGQVFEGQTLFWVGDQSGVGFYRAGEIGVFFVFDPKFSGLNDSLAIPKIGGQLLGAKSIFSASHIAMFFTYKNGPKVVNRCVLLKKNGQMLGMAEADENDGSWLGSIHGKCLIGQSVFSPTDEGIIKTDFENGGVARLTRFEGSDRFVDLGCHLLAAKEGLFCVDDSRVNLLQITR